MDVTSPRLRRATASSDWRCSRSMSSGGRGTLPIGSIRMFMDVWRAVAMRGLGCNPRWSPVLGDRCNRVPPESHEVEPVSQDGQSSIRNGQTPQARARLLGSISSGAANLIHGCITSHPLPSEGIPPHGRCSLPPHPQVHHARHRRRGTEGDPGPGRQGGWLPAQHVREHGQRACSPEYLPARLRSVPLGVRPQARRAGGGLPRGQPGEWLHLLHGSPQHDR